MGFYQLEPEDPRVGQQFKEITNPSFDPTKAKRINEHYHVGLFVPSDNKPIGGGEEFSEEHTYQPKERHRMLGYLQTALTAGKYGFVSYRYQLKGDPKNEDPNHFYTDNSAPNVGVHKAWKPNEMTQRITKSNTFGDSPTWPTDPKPSMYQ
jgi:hypothetical protein